MSVCEKEESVLEAVRFGRWNDELRHHASQCTECSEAALVQQFMLDEGEAARLESESDLPGPGLIWWKTQILEKRAAAEKATRPIAWLEKLALVVVPASIAGVAIWQWAKVGSWLAPLRIAWNQVASVGATPLLNPFLYLSAGLFMLLLLTAFAMYVAWAER